MDKIDITPISTMSQSEYAAYISNLDECTADCLSGSSGGGYDDWIDPEYEP